MDLLNKLKTKKKLKAKNKVEEINPNCLINKSDVRLAFEEDTNGKLLKYAFAKDNYDGTCTILHNGKKINYTAKICWTEELVSGGASRVIIRSEKIYDIFNKYFTNSKNLLYFHIKRNLTKAEQIYKPKKSQLKELQDSQLGRNFLTKLEKKYIWSTGVGVFVDNKNIFSTKTQDVVIQDLLDFENHMNKIMFHNNGKNYPQEYEKEVLECREKQKQELKKWEDICLPNEFHDMII